jgi:hypothetical protein
MRSSRSCCRPWRWDKKTFSFDTATCWFDFLLAVLLSRTSPTQRPKALLQSRTPAGKRRRVKLSSRSMAIRDTHERSELQEGLGIGGQTTEMLESALRPSGAERVNAFRYSPLSGGRARYQRDSRGSARVRGRRKPSWKGVTVRYQLHSSEFIAGRQDVTIA